MSCQTPEWSELTGNNMLTGVTRLEAPGREVTAEMQRVLACWPSQVEVLDECRSLEFCVWKPVVDRCEVGCSLCWVIGRIDPVKLSLLVVIKLLRSAHAFLDVPTQYR